MRTTLTIEGEGLATDGLAQEPGRSLDAEAGTLRGVRSSLAMTGWVSLVATLGILAFTLPLGGPVLLVQVANLLLIPHLCIGDLFHWSRFPRLAHADRWKWMALTVLGVALFLWIRQAGALGLSVFYLYFFGHFWKDLPLFWGHADDVMTLEDRRTKWWCGVLAVTGFGVISSGLVRDPFVIAWASRIAHVTALGLFASAGWVIAQSRRLGVDGYRPWVRYTVATGLLLVICTWFHALHPARAVLPHAVICWHFMIWYWIAWCGVRGQTGGTATGPLRGLERIKRSWPALLTLVVLTNVVVALGAAVYMTQSSFHWLCYIYNFNYLAGCWTVLHVTWDWLPKRVQGVRVSLV